MLNRNYNLTFDLQIRYESNKLEFNEFDKNTSDFFIEIKRGGEYLKLTNAIVVLVVIKPDHTVESQFLEIHENGVYANLNQNMKDLPGEYEGRALAIFGDETVTTDIIKYIVNKDDILSALNTDVVTNERYVLLTDMLNRLSLIELNENDRISSENLREIKFKEIVDNSTQILSTISEITNNKIEDVDNKIIEYDKKIKEINQTKDNLVSETTAAIDKMNDNFNNIDLNSKLKLKSIDNRKLKNNTVGVPEVDFLKCGKNLYDKNRRLINKIVQGSTPETYNMKDNSDYDVFDCIYLEQGSRVHSHPGARNLYLLNLNGECIEVISSKLQSSESFSFTISQTGYLIGSLFKSHSESWQLEIGDSITKYESYKRYLDDDIQENIQLSKKQLTDFAVESDDCTFLTIGKNLLNPINFMYDTLISKSNTIVENKGYDSYMKYCIAGTYTVSSGTRNIFGFNSNLTETGLEITLSNKLLNDPFTFTIEKDMWIGINFVKSATNRQLVLGNSTEFEPYGYSMNDLNFTKDQVNSLKDNIDIKYLDKKEIESYILENLTFNSNQLEFINNSIESFKESKLKVIKENNKFFIFSKLNINETIKYETEIENIRNNCFNFVNTYLIKNRNEILIHNQGDDIAPIRTFYTVGANHGYPCFSVPSNGQTIEDIGSVWTDGVTDYVLAKIENSKCIFLYPYIEDEQGIVSYSNIAPVMNLEAKTNATNTNVLNISSLTVEQFYPSTNNHTYDISIDDKEVSEGVNLGDEFNVTEKYNILCYKSLQEHLKSNVGIELAGDNLNAIEGVVELCINYKFKPNALILPNHTLKILKKVVLNNCNFLQSVRLQPNTEHYIPNSKQKGKWNFSNLTNINSYKDNLKFTLSDCTNPKYPLNRYVQHRNDIEGNKIGFTAGYLIDIGKGSNKERLKNNLLWDFRSTKKSYPVGYSGGTLDIGEYLNFSMYRKYISTSELKDGETNKTYFETGDGLYVFIDIHKNTVCDNLEIPIKYIDQSIEILEQNEGFELINNTVDIRGINYTIKNNYGYAILKITINQKPYSNTNKRSIGKAQILNNWSLSGNNINRITKFDTGVSKFEFEIVFNGETSDFSPVMQIPSEFAPEVSFIPITFVANGVLGSGYIYKNGNVKFNKTYTKGTIVTGTTDIINAI